ncbi:NADPH-dependent FMN reductase [Roseibium limicola]|uniref:NAD(P)H-dependent oxidoreductase n=1 Tax=Roseibium limicola TaxID=2816037 RepID=A0A939ERT6_9HYPH|nr:NAD(P)H-dependent oxidoreductase [Roseibium limicola]MBO0346398.1 NAD(P)H-dependent oxidoreductase [Roseibium limicola]
MRQPKVLLFSGSTRSGSYNASLAALAAKKLALADAKVTRISLKEYPLPLYDGDLEKDKGAPDNAVKLKKLFLAQDAIFIACPEYNAGITPLLKNTLDWISRATTSDGPGVLAFKQPIFSLGAASPGAFGGMRGLIGIRTILEVGLGAHVLPQMVSVSNAGQAFDEKGELVNERSAEQLQKTMDALMNFARMRIVG